MLVTSGVYGVDKRIVAKCCYEVVSNFEEYRLLNRDSKQTLKEIYFVNIDKETTQIVEDVFRSVFKEKKYADDDLNVTKKDISQKGHRSDIAHITPTVPTRPNLSDQTGRGPQEDKNLRVNTEGKGSSAEKPTLPGTEPKDISPKSHDIPQRKDRKLKKDDCVICMDQMDNPEKLDCGHSFCKACIEHYFNVGQPKCPSCGKLFGVLKGNQPPGEFKISTSWTSLEGYRDFKTIEITYIIPNGIQTVRNYCLCLYYS